MCEVIGIDLGTTNTVVSYYDEVARDGECCPDFEGTNLTPSAVFFEKSPEEDDGWSHVVGKVAKEIAILHPDRTATRFKRLMGITREGFRLGDREYSPQELSAFMLERAVENAEAAIDSTVRNAVITVPAYFGDLQRKATIEAGKLAGLNVIDILDEPIAALIHCTTLSDLENKVVMVIDLGGGTLDLIAARVTEERIEELEIDGDINLGGSDWDDALTEYVRKTFLTGRTLRADDEQQLCLDVESAKKVLSNEKKNNARFVVRSMDGPVEVRITREEFDACTRFLRDRAEVIIRRVKSSLEKRGIDKIDKIILAGGATRMLQIRELIRGIWPELQDSDIIRKNVDEAVACGAAAYARMKAAETAAQQIEEEKAGMVSQKPKPPEEPGSLIIDPGNKERWRKFKEIVSRENQEKVRQVVKPLRRISSRSYGLGVTVGEAGVQTQKVYNLIYRKEPLPVDRLGVKFGLSEDNMTRVALRVFENFSDELYLDQDEDFLIGECVLPINRQLPKGSIIEVSFRLREDGTLYVYGTEPTGHTRIEMTLRSRALLGEEKEIKNIS